MISGETKVYGIIGNPISHTMSPTMHNAAFKELRLNCIYVPFLVEEAGLVYAIEGMRAMDIKGLNVTMPHKLTIIPLLDHLDPLAEKIGAVNTVVNSSGILTGYNTDAAGFIKALLDNCIYMQGQRVVVMGAGGVSRAICFALAEQKYEVCIINRTYKKALRLANEISHTFNRDFKAYKMNEKNLKSILSGANILVNATSIGMDSTVDRTPVAAALLNSELVVFDTIYRPIETKLLKSAKNNGARVIGGLDMLLWQGAIAFKLWTGLEAPFGTMKKEVSSILGLNED
jgi:shikimate dehydrogenase